MAEHLFEPAAAAASAERRGRATRRPDAVHAARRRRGRRASATSTGCSGSARAPMVLRQAGEQRVHPVGRILERRDHVGAELGIVGVPLGVARDQRQLADEVLDVVQDEREAAVELVEPRGVGERGMRAILGQIARRLPPGDAQQVEILPVERAGRPAGARAGSRRPGCAPWISGTQRPGVGVVAQPVRDAAASSAGAVAAADLIQLDDARAGGEMVAQRRVGGPPPSCQFQAAPGARPPPSGTSSSPAGESVRSAIALTMRRSSGSAPVARRAERRGEALPFGAIIVAVAEEMLGDLHLEPGAQPRRRQQRHQRGGRAEHDRGLRRSAHAAGIALGDAGRERGDRRHRAAPARSTTSAQPRCGRDSASVRRALRRRWRAAARRRPSRSPRSRDRRRRHRSEAVAEQRDEQVDAPHRRRAR